MISNALFQYVRYFMLALPAFFAYAYGQVVIGGDNKPTSKPYVLLELKSDHTKDTGQGFMLPMAKTTKQRDSITNEKETGGSTTNTKFPRGGMVYNVEKHTVDIWTKKDNANEWRSLAYTSASSKIPELVSLDSTFITTPSSTSGSGNNTDLQTITLELPEGYKLYKYKGEQNGGGSSSTPQDSFVVSISYNGFKLVPYVDFKPEAQNSSNTGSSPSQKESLKITFLTLVPESKKELDKILVQCIRAEK